MNYDATSVELIRQTLIVALKIAAPILIAGVIFGLVLRYDPEARRSLTKKSDR